MCYTVASITHTRLDLRSESSGLILVVKKRGTFLVNGNGRLTASPSATSDSAAADEESGHADKGKDPLESDDLVEKLPDAEGGRKNAESEADGIVLEDKEAEVAEHRDGPDEDVGKDPSKEVVRVVHRKSTVPV